MKALNMAAEEVHFVGDELEHDILGAKRVGMKTAHVVGDEPKEDIKHSMKPDYIINSLSDLKTILDIT